MTGTGDFEAMSPRREHGSVNVSDGDRHATQLGGISKRQSGSLIDFPALAMTFQRIEISGRRGSWFL